MTRYYNQNMQKKKLQTRWTIFRIHRGSAVYLLVAFLMIYQKDYNSIKSKLTFKKKIVPLPHSPFIKVVVSLNGQRIIAAARRVSRDPNEINGAANSYSVI